MKNLCTKMLKVMVLAILCIVFVSGGIFGNDLKFRNVEWGMSIDEVKDNETAKFYTEFNKEHTYSIVYKTKINNYSTLLLYNFYENKLFYALYLFTEKHSNDNLYIKDYEELKRMLINKYGEPDTDEIEWSNDLYKDTPQDYGFSVSAGYHEYSAYWYDKNDVSISISLMGDNFKINHSIYYFYKPIWELVQKHEQENNVLDL